MIADVASSSSVLANLNTQLFTPCLIFTKLASQLTADKLSDLAVIPVIFVVQTIISYVAAILVSKICGFKKRASNFLVAMAVWPPTRQHRVTADKFRSLVIPTPYLFPSSSHSRKHCQACIGTKFRATTTMK
jgi:hypothetical protein